MASGRGGRTQDCSRADARRRLEQARSFSEVASLTVDEASDELDYASVSASLSVLAGIAAADAACCRVLGKRARGQNHNEAVALLETIPTDGVAAGVKLRQLLGLKDTAQYGVVSVSKSQVKQALRSADWLVKWAERVVSG